MEDDSDHSSGTSSSAFINFHRPSKKDAEKAYAIWDPLDSPDWIRPPNPICLKRVNKDIEYARRNPLPGIFIFPLEENLTTMVVQIRGPADTPYSGVCFHFMVRVSPDYPYRPPRIRFLDADTLSLRISPHFYFNGRVCLSIIGTWPGPGWSAACTISGLMVSLQSILSSRPLFYDPVFGGNQLSEDEVTFYNRIVRHECIRNFLKLVDKETIGKFAEDDNLLFTEDIRMNLIKQFLQNFDELLADCTQHLPFASESFSRYVNSSWHTHFIRDGNRSTQWPCLILEMKRLKSKVEQNYPDLLADAEA